MTSPSGQVTYAQSYDPYGTVRGSSQLTPGTSTTYGFTGEQQDPSGMTYLRARYYNPVDGRFMSRDTWGGDMNRPLSMNRWGYVEGNPVNYADPTGFIKKSESIDADKIVKELRTYNVFIKVDWGEHYYYTNITNKLGVSPCGWQDGEWTLWELKELRKGTVDLARAMGGLNKFIFGLGYVNILKEIPKPPNEKSIAVTIPHQIKVNTIYHTEFDRWSAVYELAHAWDWNFDQKLSQGLVIFTLSLGPNPPATCDTKMRLPGCNKAGYFYAGTPVAGASEKFNHLEDFAESVTAYVYPDEAQAKVQQYFRTNYEPYLYYTDYHTTSRWKYIRALIQTNKSYQQQ